MPEGAVHYTDSFFQSVSRRKWLVLYDLEANSFQRPLFWK